MAIRNLKLLLSQINYYESRILTYIDRLKLADPPDIRFIEYLEEIIDWCKSLQEVCLTSIENWEDIIPEASNLISMIGTFSELRITENNLKSQLSLLMAKLSEAEQEKDKTAESKQLLEEQLKNKEEELSKVTKQIQDLRKEIKRGVLAGITTSSTALGTSATSISPSISPFASALGNALSVNSLGKSPLGGTALGVATCQFCNKIFNPTSIDSSMNRICDECRKAGKGPLGLSPYIK